MYRNMAALSILAALASTGCKQDINVTSVDAEIAIAPTLTDLGTIPVGETVEFNLQVDYQKGAQPVKIQNISVNNINDDGAQYFLPPETITYTIERGTEGFLIPFTYTPTQVGYHRATIEIIHNGKDGKVTLDARARAVLPDATVWPLGLDFGPVAVGDNSQRQLTISNQSDLVLTITEANTSNSVFEFVDALPLTVNGGNEQVVSLRFVPTDDQPQTGRLTLRAGSVELPQVDLRGNDCTNGDPDAYDVDGDGYTSCGGDCDDNAPAVHPGAVETANAVDDDCDGSIDEGTPWADDDGDGFCDDPSYCSDGATPGDCSDSADPSANTAAVNPSATEIMNNGIDDDCDGVVDQGTTDADGDGYSPAGGDCDDNDATTYPGAPELPDFVNNDCDLFVDEGTVYYDDDGDGYCEDGTTCSDGSLTGDCDDDVNDLDGVGGPDGRPTNPGATEIYDWRDNNCDGVVDEGTIGYDDDGDGYTEVGGDCDDGDPAVSPALGNCP